MTNRADIPMPGLLWGDYPQRLLVERPLGQRLADGVRALAGRCGAVLRRSDAAFLARVHAAESGLTGIDAAGLRALRLALARDGLHGATLAQCFAMVSLACRQRLGRRPFDTQLIAARAVVECRLAEMATGEGKTLATAIAAATAALAGMPVHVVTANDYLVERDARSLEPLYAALGLSVGAVVQADSPPHRGAAYARDITYVTAKELVFDYLRDRLAHAGPDRHLPAAITRLCAEPGRLVPPRLLRGLCMAIVDEADAILIDEARVPLVLSRAGDMAESHQHAERALQFARTLEPGLDFTPDAASRSVRLTPRGEHRLAMAAAALDEASASAAWRNRFHREHAVCTALSALHLQVRDRQYLVRDGKVAIIDETTGRVAEGRAWSNGLQQLVEIKEGCAPSPALATVAQITYQRFFPRYVRLGGLSGTLDEARFELLSTYGRSVRPIPLRRRCLRRVGPARLFADHPRLWDAVARRVAELHRLGRPVLVATDSVAESLALAERLAACGLPHQMLHARCDSDEAEAIARAGARGSITVTTNIAGRGTDIGLGDGIAELGGLHLICCQLNGARRIDRQLAGRAARQGDPGSVETWLSLDTTLLAQFWPAWTRRALQPVAPALPSRAVRMLARAAQRFEEGRQRGQRARLIQQDIRTERELAFGGRVE